VEEEGLRNSARTWWERTGKSEKDLGKLDEHTKKQLDKTAGEETLAYFLSSEIREQIQMNISTPYIVVNLAGLDRNKMTLH
jgi:hypothetical protein